MVASHASNRARTALWIAGEAVGDAGVGDDDVQAAELLYGTSDHALLTGEVADVDGVGGDLGALVLDQPNGLGQILGLSGRVADVRTNRTARIDGHDVRPGAGQPDAVRPALSAGGTGDVGDSAFEWPLCTGGHADTLLVGEAARDVYA